MNKELRKILIISAAVFGFGLLSVNSVWAEANGITIIPEPIFNIGNFVPGQSVSSNVIIKNNSDKNYQSIIIDGERSSSESAPDLAKVIDLEIKKGGEAKSVNLAEILNGEILILPDGGINNGEEKQFEFTAKLDEDLGNEYQGKSIEFDFIFSFTGEEATEKRRVLGSRGGETVSLYIYNEKTEEVAENSATITWETTRLSFGRVIYDTLPDQFNFAAGEPAYGYAFFSPRTEKQDTFHSITLTGLSPGTTYYYRIVAYGSIAISQEFVFTTLGTKGEEVVFQPPVFGPPLISEVFGKETREEGVEEEELLEEPGLTEVTVEEGPIIDLTGLLAAVGNLFKLKNFYWLILLLLVIIIIILLLLRRRKKKSDIKNPTLS